MQEEQKTSQKCFACRNWERYYTKGIKPFEQTKCGWCSQQKDVISSQSGCDHFVRRKYNRRARESLRYYLNRLLAELSSIRVVIEQEIADEEEIQK